MPMTRPALAHALGALALLAAPLSLPAGAAEPGAGGPAVVVLDGSGSMWGTIGSERTAKFDLARGALRKELATLAPSVRLGLMSYGHRRRADCSDVEVLAPPQAGGPERVLALADKINPRGKGPLALALKEAAKEIPPGEAGSVIVVHDGPDNCWQDPCASAAEIAKANPRTRVFLVGFGLEAADAQKLQCVARATDGRVLVAPDAASLAPALAEALTLANLARIDPGTGIAVPAPQAATPPTPAGAPGLRLSAALAADAPPLKAAVQWSVAKAGEPQTALKRARAAELALDLEPGTYVVTARYGHASGEARAEVTAAGPTPLKVSLEAGVLRLGAHAGRGGAALAEPLITIFPKDGAGAEAARPVWIGRNAAAELVLPAGAYAVTVEDGLARETAEVTVKAGAGADLAPVLGTGRLELSAVAAETGEPIGDVAYTIEEDDPDSPEGRRTVARSADPAAAFTLPAGTYYVTAAAGVAVSRDRIALGSGDTVKQVARFNLVPLTVTAALNAPDGERGPPPIRIRILTEYAAQREIARANGATGAFRLPPARYRVEAVISGENVKAQGIVDLTSGRGGGVKLKLDAAEVAVRAGGGGGARHWRIADGEGRTVMHAMRGADGRARLAPGRYVLITDTGERRAEQAFDLKAGERRELVLGGS